VNLYERAKILWFVAGLLSLAIGIVGIVLPLLPTAPFVILAAFCFARSSPRLEYWLETHPRFGPTIANWRRYGAISKRAKVFSVATMAASPFFTWMIGAPLWALAAQIVCLLGAAAFVLTRPSV
jgi:uncharacterized membrane protein YbaN (DUF454 family)